MADVVALVLRFFHIFFGIAWIGALMYGVGVLRRALAGMEMPARQETMRRLIPVLTQYIPGSAAMTILFGFILYLWIGSLEPAVLLESNWGRTLLAALVLSLTAFGIGTAVGVRGARRMLVHLNEEACAHGPEVAALQKRFNLSQFTGLGLGLIIVALMVLATERVF
ncbi:MAG TPA: hypothetical protein VFA17_00055 [Thermoplasmata archaeon]|jgi:uncharacterized membrane protein|nr:hypothetical protein [Thermoplasmata archaeon]